jgi:hypothetical protein
MILALTLALLQDDASIAEAVAKLADASIQIREEAARELVKIGAAALPHLEKIRSVADPDLRERVDSTIRAIRARERARKLNLDTIIPAALQAKYPDLLDRAGAEDSEVRRQLLEDLQAEFDGGNLADRDLLWIGALLKGGATAPLRTMVYLRARRWWYEAVDDEVSAAGGRILAQMGEEFLRDWPRILVRIADSPEEVMIFDAEILNSMRGGTEDGQVSAAAIAELAELGGVEMIPVLVDIATDYNADPTARKAAMAGISAFRRKFTK